MVFKIIPAKHFRQQRFPKYLFQLFDFGVLENIYTRKFELKFRAGVRFDDVGFEPRGAGVQIQPPP